MTNLIDPSLFDFVDEFADQAREPDTAADDLVATNLNLVVFCEGFFAQFFESALKVEITGFGPEAQRVAASILAKGGLKREVRSLVSLFESFCDWHMDVAGAGYEIPDMTWRRFHTRYLARLLQRSAAWVRIVDPPQPQLRERLDSANANYDAAIRALQW
jgi:hypothetical protein